MGKDKKYPSAIHIEKQNLEFSKARSFTDLPKSKEAMMGFDQILFIKKTFPGKNFLEKKVVYKKSIWQKTFALKDFNPIEVILLFESFFNSETKKDYKKLFEIIKTSVKKYSYHPDAHTLNAAFDYRSTQAVDPNERLMHSYEILKEITAAIFNGGFSIFSIREFMYIYNSHLDNFKYRAGRVIQVVSPSSDRMKKILEQLKRYENEARNLKFVKQDFDRIHYLEYKFSGLKAYRITAEDIQGRIEDLEDMGNKRKTLLANNLIYITTHLLEVIAKIPLLSSLFKEFLAILPLEASIDSSPNVINIILRTRGILSTQLKHELDVAKSNKDQGEINAVATELFRHSKATIDDYVMATGLRLIHKYQVDPILDLVNVLLDHQTYFMGYNKELYAKELNNAHRFLKYSLTHCPKKKYQEILLEIYYKVGDVIVSHGWLEKGDENK